MSKPKQWSRDHVMGYLAAKASFTRDRKQPMIRVRIGAGDGESGAALKRVLGGVFFSSSTFWQARGPQLIDLLPELDQHLPPGRKRVQFEVWLQRHELEFAAALHD
jgi:hypothetical protein